MTFDSLTNSWELALNAENYSRNSINTWRQGVSSLSQWLAADTAPAEVTRDQLRGWLVHLRETGHSPTTARIWFKAVQRFYAWALEDGELDHDPTVGIRTPRAAEPETRLLTMDELQRLLDTCTGTSFTHRRDNAILRLFADTGVRLGEMAGLRLEDVNPFDHVIYVVGKGSRRGGPRHRAVTMGVKTARALDKYKRLRDQHPYAGQPAFWLGRDGPLKLDGIDAMVKRRAAEAGLKGVHPHVFRHTFAHQFRQAGGSEGDLMQLGGWRSRSMLDRYGAGGAADRAAEAGRRLSLGDRI